jgi:hypothetical protein
MVVALLYLSAATSGILAGAMLTEAGVLVPYWRALPPTEFLAWYAANHRRLFGFFAPVTAVAALSAVAAAVAAAWTQHPGRGFALLAAAVVIALAAMFPLYFQGVNDAFAAGTMPAADVPAALRRWDAWHQVRTVGTFVALAASLLALRAGAR